jgi:hypothetical protein
MRATCIITLVSNALLPLASGDLATWHNVRGQSFEAEFVRVHGADAVFTLANGRSFATPVVELAPQHRAVLQKARDRLDLMQAPETVSSTFSRPWPREIRLDGPVNSRVVSEDPKTGRYIYETPNYRFTCESPLTAEVISNFSVMFETTYRYAQSIPLSLGSGRKREGKLDIFLFASMSSYVKAGGPPGSGGCFFRGFVLVPMASLGLTKSSTGFTLDRKRDNSILVHELAHQLTPEAYFVPGARGWFTEGLAETMAVTPYSWNYFSIDTSGTLEKDYVTANGRAGNGGRALGTTIHAPRLKHFLTMPYEQFSGANANMHYGIALLVTHYFLQMEGDGKARKITQFLKSLHSGASGDAALAQLLGGDSYETLENKITTAWAKKGIQIQFSGGF